MSFPILTVSHWIRWRWQKLATYRTLITGGLLLAVILSNWGVVEAQRAQRQPRRKTPPAATPQPPPAEEITTPLPLAEYFPADTLFYGEVERLTDAIDEVLAVENLRRFLADSESPLPIDLTQYAEALSAIGLPDKAILAATRVGIGLMLAPNQKKINRWLVPCA